MFGFIYKTSTKIDWKSLKWYFVTKIVLTYCEKKLFWRSRKTFEIQGWRPRIFKILKILSERSEQFLLTECFFNLFLEISQISKNRTIIIQIGKKYWDLEICRKSEDIYLHLDFLSSSSKFSLAKECSFLSKASSAVIVVC
jgi:hypothetical protein